MGLNRQPPFNSSSVLVLISLNLLLLIFTLSFFFITSSSFLFIPFFGQPPSAGVGLRVSPKTEVGQLGRAWANTDRTHSDRCARWADRNGRRTSA